MRSASETLAQALARLPLVSILRGLRPQEAQALGQAIVDARWRIIEVPLNSPGPARTPRR